MGGQRLQVRRGAARLWGARAAARMCEPGVHTRPARPPRPPACSPRARRAPPPCACNYIRRFRPWELAEGSCITNESDPQGRPAFPRPEPEAVERLPLPLRPSVFQLLDEQTRALGRMLLGGVSRAQPSPAT